MDEPIGIDEACIHLRVDRGVEDDLIEGLIVAAREHVEGYTGLILTQRTVVEEAASFGRYIELRSWPVSAITGITYYDNAGTAQTLDSTAWLVANVSRPARILPAVANWWPSSLGCWSVKQRAPIAITMTAGYAADDVPGSVKAAMLLMVGHLFTNREAAIADSRAAAIELPLGVEALLRRWRLRSV